MDESNVTIELLKQKVEDFLVIADEGVIEVLLAAVVAFRLSLDPVWLMVVAGSSSGKSELINPLYSLSFVIPISDLTANTFASGYKMGGGTSASLLQRHQNGVLVFKDFTTLLSKSRETRDMVLGQMREVYDGKYDKQTGTGETISWKGKMGAIAAATEAVYINLAESSEMGQRFIYYHVKQPDRQKAARRAQENAIRGTELRNELSTIYKAYVTKIIKHINENDVDLTLEKNFIDEMLLVADFSTLARSPVHVDYKSGMPDATPWPEMPGRVTKQLCALASAFIAMNLSEGKSREITQGQREILYRCAYDSIPVMRRRVLKLMAQYKQGATTTGLGVKLNLPTESIKKYLAQINALGLIKRQKRPGSKGDIWIMEHDIKGQEWRSIIAKLEGITVMDELLEPPPGFDETYDDMPGVMSEVDFNETGNTKTADEIAAEAQFNEF